MIQYNFYYTSKHLQLVPLMGIFFAQINFVLSLLSLTLTVVNNTGIFSNYQIHYLTTVTILKSSKLSCDNHTMCKPSALLEHTETQDQPLKRVTLAFNSRITLVPE